MSETYTWLITGTSRGIGLEMVRQLSASLSNITIATCRNPAGASDLKVVKENAKGVVHIVPLAVTSETSIRESVKLVSEILGDKGLNYLYNNAGINEGDDVAFGFDWGRFERTMFSNVAGPATLAQVYLPYLEKSKRKVIVNMSSGLGSVGLDCGSKCSIYSVSKAALNMLTYKQAKEKPDIIAFVIDPGWVKTVMGGDGAVLEPEFSVNHILKLVTSASSKDTGKFFRYTGEEIPW